MVICSLAERLDLALESGAVDIMILMFIILDAFGVPVYDMDYNICPVVFVEYLGILTSSVAHI